MNLGAWRNCDSCGQRYEVSNWHWAMEKYCSDCLDFDVNLGVMDWRLFQAQRAVLIELVDNKDGRLDGVEVEALKGVLILTDHIVSCAEEAGRRVPSLDEILLDRIADAGRENGPEKH